MQISKETDPETRHGHWVAVGGGACAHIWATSHPGWLTQWLKWVKDAISFCSCLTLVKSNQQRELKSGLFVSRRWKKEVRPTGRGLGMKKLLLHMLRDIISGIKRVSTSGLIRVRLTAALQMILLSSSVSSSPHLLFYGLMTKAPGEGSERTTASPAILFSKKI